ncbi:MAG TPA: PAS domain S-box protein [Candidatus Tyrphobacter sp.]
METALLESLPDAMIIVDVQGHIRYVNHQAEKLFGYERDELLGQPIEMLVPQRFASRHTQHRAGYLHDPHVRPMGAGLELLGRRKDGGEIPVEIMLSPIQGKNGMMVASAIRNVSERKQFEAMLQAKNAELENANAAKDQFLASMSHELRTPLNAIIGFTGTLLMQLPGPLTLEQEKQLRIVQTSARHLLSLIGDILDLAKIEAGKVELHFEPVVVDDVVEEVRDALRSLASDKQLDFTVVLPKSRAMVTTDRRALQQILLNLANNAVKYTQRGSVTIAVTNHTADDGMRVVVDVADTGIGIKADDRERLFQAFEQLDPSSTRRIEGAGLGLYLSQKLAVLIGSRLSFTSEFGAGSTFTLSLPVAGRS